MSNVLLFDCDGVLCDSALECFVTAYNAHGRAFSGRHWDVYDVDAIDDEWQGAFLRYRPLVRTAREYGLLWQAVIAERHLDESVSLWEQIDSLTEGDLDRFEKAFFAFRNDWREKAPKSWLRCHTVYPGIQQLLQLAGAMPFFILSAKDKPSLCALAQYYQWPIPDSHIYGTGEGGDKDIQLDRLILEHGIRPEQCVFIDDNLQNLRLLAGCGVRPLWAKWGYLTLRELAIEALDGVKVLEGVSQLQSWVLQMPTGGLVRFAGKVGQ